MVYLYHHKDKCYIVTSYGMGSHSFPDKLMSCADLTILLWWEVMDLNHRRWKPNDLQSFPFDRSGNFPNKPFQPYRKLDYYVLPTNSVYIY